MEVFHYQKLLFPEIPFCQREIFLFLFISFGNERLLSSILPHVSHNEADHLQYSQSMGSCSLPDISLHPAEIILIQPE